MLNYSANGPSGYNLTNSLRFRASNSANLQRTPASATNRKTWTWSAWVKRGTIGSITQGLFLGNYDGNDNSTYFGFSGDQFFFFNRLLTVANGNIYTTQVFRDVSAWYHIVVAMDTTQATAANRFKLYINGNQVTSFAIETYPTQNTDMYINSNVQHNIGFRRDGSTNSYFDGYLAEINFVDGSQLTPSSFGNYNSTTGVWQPAKYTGTYGTNGFYLNFSSIALTSGSNTGLGKDNSGNGNYWNTNNISVTAGTTYDAMTDVPTNTSATVANYCVLNPLNKNTNVTVSNANLTSTSAVTNAGISGTMYVKSSGKYYWEATCTTKTTYPIVGIVNEAWSSGTNALTYPGATSGSYGYANDGLKYNNGSTASYGASYTSGDIIGVALDLDAGTLTFYKNNTSQGTAYTGLTDSYAPAISGQGSDVWNMNFGQRPFSYTPPTGYVALNTFNLPSSTIPQGNKYMDATLYTGNGSTQTITNTAGFKPDLVWIKSRNFASSHALADSVRGVSLLLNSNSTNAESTQTNSVTSLNANGFSLGADSSTWVNYNTSTLVGWQWQAGQGSTSSNTSGSITSTVSVNTTAGFSVVTYTGTGANATVGHGLGVAPKMVIVKVRNTTDNWLVYNSNFSTPATDYLILNTTAAKGTFSGYWNGGANSSTFGVGGFGSINGSGYTYVAYCWAEIAGFSKFGSYTGNGSTDGPFVYTGFRPKYVMIKVSSTTEDWYIWDTSRGTYNANTPILYADLSAAESTSAIDTLSNGFKCRTAQTLQNANGATYIYMAFAESPFRNSLAR